METIEKGDIIGFYYGVIVSKEEYQLRRRAGGGGYGVRVDVEFVKDCKAAYDAGICLISAANSAVKLKHQITDSRSSANCSIVVKAGRPYLRACAGRDIMPHEEIFTSYGSSLQLYKDYS